MADGLPDRVALLSSQQTGGGPHDWLIEEKITPETAFKMSASQKTLIRYDSDTQSAAIHVRGHLLQLNAMPETLLAPMFETTGVVLTGTRLLEHCPELGWDKLKAMLLSLYSAGVLELSEPETTVWG